MKNAILIILTSYSICPALHAQGGPLVPPGPPAPMMKTLDQIEPRTDLENLASDANNRFVISQPGSYYFSSNVTVTGKHGIIIHVDGVSIDMKGFALIGDATPHLGITSSVAVKNIRISDGIIRGFGTGGMFLNGSAQIHLSDLVVRENGGPGIYVGESSIVSRCIVKSNGGQGLRVTSQSSVIDCEAANNVNEGIVVGNDSSVQRCSSSSNTNDGILLGLGTTAGDCAASGNTGNGFIVGDNSTVRHCSSRSNGQHGFFVGSRAVLSHSTAASNTLNGFEVDDATVENCSASGNLKHGIQIQQGIARANSCIINGIGAGVNDGAGIRATGAALIEGNFCKTNDKGISGAAAVVIRNYCYGNTGSGMPSANFDVSGTGVAPIGNAATATSTLANIVSP